MQLRPLGRGTYGVHAACQRISAQKSGVGVQDQILNPKQPTVLRTFLRKSEIIIGNLKKEGFIGSRMSQRP